MDENGSWYIQQSIRIDNILNIIYCEYLCNCVFKENSRDVELQNVTHCIQYHGV